MPWLTDPSITNQMQPAPNPLEAYMRFAQLKQMGQEQQYNQARLAHLTQEDERSRAMLPSDVASAQTAIKERLSKLDNDQLTQLKTKNELIGQYLGVVDSAPPEAKPQAYQFAVAAAERDKLIPPGVAPPWGPQAEMLVKQQLGQASTVQQHIDNEFKNRQQTDVETQNAAVRTNMVGQRDLEKRGQDMTALTAKMGQGVTMRGQNMTNARATEQNKIADQTRLLQQQKLQNELTQQQVGNEGAAASFDTALDTLGRLKTHPGFQAAVGAGLGKTLLPGIGPIAGTNRADFVAELDAFKAQTFLPMVQKLRGMGALSDAEGKKLADAVGALNTNMSEKAFSDSVDRITTNLQEARNRVPGVAKKDYNGSAKRIWREVQ